MPVDSHHGKDGQSGTTDIGGDGMTRSSSGRMTSWAVAGGWLVLAGCAVDRPACQRVSGGGRACGRVVGVVYHDRNGNRMRDGGEPGLSGIRVSNGREVVRTDPTGRYALDVADDTIIFVIKPSGWRTPVDGSNLPQFYYLHKPCGSPALKYGGVPATGPLPAGVDFPLERHAEPQRFRVIVFGDTQPYAQEEIDLLGHDIVEELVGFDAAFGVTLGDIVGDDLSLFAPLARTVAHIGLPWYNVAGNHDMDYDAPDDLHANETFERVFGPPYYSFDYGRGHFIVLDDVTWLGAGEEEKGKYRGEIGARQLAFIRNDLAETPRDRLVVLMMHIPLMEVVDREVLFALLADHPHTLSLSAHHHTMHHRLFGREDGWKGERPHHHFVAPTTCGSWWRGQLDEEQIPHATMRDGAPNGYCIVTLDGHDYSIRFKAARRPVDHQMTIFAPDEVSTTDLAGTEVLVNFFMGAADSVVEMRVGKQGAWKPMVRAERDDPYFVLMKQAEEQRGQTQRRLPKVEVSPHLWSANLPESLAPGSHLIQIRAKDMFDQTFTDRRAIRIVE